MNREPYAETDPLEVRSSRKIVEFFRKVHRISDALESAIDPEPGSAFDGDNQRIPTRPISDYSFRQLTVAIECLKSLERMLVREDAESISLVLSPFGQYALIRNSLDSLTVAIWLLQPETSTCRIKRQLRLEANEVHLASAYIGSHMGQKAKGWREPQDERIAEIAKEAKLRSWNPHSKKVPTTTQMLQEIQPPAQSGQESWLSLWQLVSGHAHGKRWPDIHSHDLAQQAGTENQFGAKFWVTASYGLLAQMLQQTMQMLDHGVGRYVELSRH